MDYELSEKEKQRKNAFQSFCKKEIVPLAERLAARQGEGPQLLRTLMKKLGEAGHLGLGLPLEAGGQGEGLVLQMAFGETLAKESPTAHLAAWTSGVHCGHLLARFGKGEKIGEILGDLLSGRKIAALARTEPSGGTILEGMATKMVQNRQGWRISGRKSFCVNGPVADLFVVFGLLESLQGAGEGVCAVLVPAGRAGVGVEPEEEALGYSGLPVGSLVLGETPVEESWLLGGADRGAEVLEESWQWDALGATAGSIGVIEASLEAAFGHSQQRQSGGKPLAAYQEVAFKLAEARAMLDTARLLGQKAAWMKQIQDPEAETLISCAKLYASEAATKCAGYALQILGGKGARRGCAAGEWLLAAKLNEIAGGTSEAHRLRIARSVLNSV